MFENISAEKCDLVIITPGSAYPWHTTRSDLLSAELLLGRRIPQPLARAHHAYQTFVHLLFFVIIRDSDGLIMLHSFRILA